MKTYILKTLILSWLCLASTLLIGQQIPISTIQVLHTGPFNPGRFPAGDLSEVHFNVQQRAMGVAGWSSGSQFLQYKHRPMGAKKSFTFGLNVTNDKEHSESRLAFSPQVSAKVLDKGNSALSVGISAGFINRNSNFSALRSEDPGDPEFSDQAPNSLSLDAGLGASYRIETQAFRFEAGVMGSQLAGMIPEEDLDDLYSKAYVTANASFLYHVNPDFAIGPRAFYRGFLKEESIRDDSLPAVLELEPRFPKAIDLGLVLEIPDKDMWAGASYRLNSQVVNAGFGMRLMRTDTTPLPEVFASFVDANVGFSYPVGGTSVFGPTVEVGLTWTFGKKADRRVRFEKKADIFWKSEASMTAHRVAKIDPGAPPKLGAEVLVVPKSVYMTYSFPDLSRRYIGDAPKYKNDSLLYRIGMEWPGLDGLLENLPKGTIKEAFWPDTTGVVDLENLEPLKKLAWIELSANLRGDENGVHFSSEMPYEGELGTNNASEDTLFIDIVFNGEDTTMAIRKGAMTTQLELAALKLHAMRRKLEYELMAQLGDNFVVVWEGVTLDEDSDDYRTPIEIRKPRVTPNNPQMQFLQENEIKLKFLRDRKYVQEVDDGWIDVVIPDSEGPKPTSTEEEK